MGIASAQAICSSREAVTTMLLRVVCLELMTFAFRTLHVLRKEEREIVGKRAAEDGTKSGVFIAAGQGAVKTSSSECGMVFEGRARGICNVGINRTR